MHDQLCLCAVHPSVSEHTQRVMCSCSVIDVTGDKIAVLCSGSLVLPIALDLLSPVLTVNGPIGP